MKTTEPFVWYVQKFILPLCQLNPHSSVHSFMFFIYTCSISLTYAMTYPDLIVLHILCILQATQSSFSLSLSWFRAIIWAIHLGSCTPHSNTDQCKFQFSGLAEYLVLLARAVLEFSNGIRVADMFLRSCSLSFSCVFLLSYKSF